MNMQSSSASSLPRVSVITIFLNGKEFLVEAMESVIGQTFADWELLLVDDGSTDASSEIAKGYAARYPEKIRYFEHPGHINRGMSATRNLGIANARGEYLTFIDADDVWLPSKLADQVAIMDAHPDVGMVCGTAIYWSSWAGGEDRIVPSGFAQDCVVVPPDTALRMYPVGRGIAPCDPLCRTKLAREVGGYEERFRGMFEDQAFLVKLYLKSPIYVASKVWMKYRQHEKSCCAVVMVTGKHDDARRYFFNWLDEYLATVPRLDERVTAAVRRALLPYRYPAWDFLLTLPSRIRASCRRILAS